MFFKNCSGASRLLKTVIFEVAKQSRCEQSAGSTTNELEPMRGEKGSASRPRKEIGGTFSRFENAEYPVDTADIYGSFSFVLMMTFMMGGDPALGGTQGRPP